MNLITATLFPAATALPPVINCEHKGNIRRNFCAQTIRQRGGPAAGTRTKLQAAEAAENRALILAKVVDGCDNIHRLVDSTTKNHRTIWSHIHALAAEGKIRIDKSVRPWLFCPAAAPDRSA